MDTNEEIKELKELKEQVCLGLRRAYKKMVKFKKQKKTPLVVSDHGKVIMIPPDEIPPTTKSKN